MRLTSRFALFRRRLRSLPVRATAALAILVGQAGRERALVCIRIEINLRDPLCSGCRRDQLMAVGSDGPNPSRSAF
jgi:hypothetical protein